MNTFLPPRLRRTLAAALVPLLLLASAVPPAQAEEALGRLFFTPERRQQLDRQRELNALSQQEAQEDPTLRIDGVVTRSSGRRTVWINGVAHQETGGPGDLAVTPHRKDPSRVLVQPSQSPAVNASVGETIKRNTGETEKIIGNGKIIPNPSHATHKK